MMQSIPRTYVHDHPLNALAIVTFPKPLAGAGFRARVLTVLP